MYSRSLFRQCLHFYSSSGKVNNAAALQQSLAVLQHLTTLAIPLTVSVAKTRYHNKLPQLSSVNKLNKHLVCLQSTQHAVNRTAVTSRMVQPQQLETGKMSKNGKQLGEMDTVIRYQRGEERFQMQVTLVNGKTFNFDRKVSDTVSNVVARMVTNIEKKVKKFSGPVKFLTHVKLDEETTEIEKLFEMGELFSNGLKLQVEEHVYDIVLNPPEVYAIKFVNVCMPTLPIFPYRLEKSSNFDKIASLYKWEFSRDKPSEEIPEKLRKKSKQGEASKASIAATWVECGSSFIFTPEPDMEGGYLRFSCTPSNGKVFGRSFSTVLGNPIVPLQVDTFLYQERLLRLVPKMTEGDCLRVMTYNILADTYATPEWFISSPKESLDVGYRLPLLNKEIAEYQADLICLQEVDEKYFEGNFEPYLAMQGYKGRHTSKTGNTKEGIATFHNTAKLTEIKFNQFVILDEMKSLPLWERLKSVGDGFTKRLEERNTVFHASVFQVNHNSAVTKSILILGNVHLYFHPDADHIRLLQTVACIHLLESMVAQVQKEHADAKVAVMFCGDFNCTPPYSSYRLLTTGQLEENDEDWTSHPEEKISPGISIKHALNLTNSHPGEELTNITTCFEGCLDYILYQANHFELLSTCPPPSKETLTVLTKVDEPRKVSLPNFHVPSDHLPLIADFKIKSEIK